jgi:maltooligosyltrehalose trehalohydrolase
LKFEVWAPRAKAVSVKLVGGPGAGTSASLAPMPVRDSVAESVEPGWFFADVPDARAGTDYLFRLDSGPDRPDPRSRYQPQGPHGPSRVVDVSSFRWTDPSWRGLPLEDCIIYELHIGTFTPEGTFDGVASRLPYLRSLGVTAIELMPVAEFPGGRNWGYDGVSLYAPQSSYGGPEGLQRLVDAAHAHGIAVVLDVVYNHLGPEGNYLPEFGPYFTDHYRTPWGPGINFDGEDSDAVRRFYVENAVYWLRDFHIDGLRLDAAHGIVDTGARHILEEMATAFHDEARRLGRAAWLIAESDLNDVRLIKDRAEGGFGLDAQWNDDFHHALHVLLTGNRRGYFTDFGHVSDLAKALSEGFVYDGTRRSAARRRRHGSSSADRPGRQFVICTQNHDQIANGSVGRRHGELLSIAQQKLAADVLFFAPNVPMLFMGQEWGETAPFEYFTSHGDRALGAAVSKGRMAEYAPLMGGRECPDPQAPETFERSKLDWGKLERAPHAEILHHYREAIARRRELCCLASCRKDLTRVSFDEDARRLTIERRDPDGSAATLNLQLGPERWHSEATQQ